MASNKSRDEFTVATKRAIERQARSHCSNPMCRRLTSAAASDGVGEINIGEAAHICAAAPGGPRYDPNMTSEVRRSAENGIWLCRLHARAIDSNDPQFTVALLQDWKRKTDRDSWRSVLHDIPFAPNMHDPDPHGLPNRLRAAARDDLAVFRKTAKWPATAVPLTLTVEKLETPLTTTDLAKAVLSLDDLILVAAPGMGKTTTIFQVAEAVMELGNATAIILPLGDWATEQEQLLTSILRRPAFAGLSEAEFRAVAAKQGVVVLFDGWNEMDAAAQEKARIQVARLKAELPELGFVLSTRKQALDVPFSGTRVSLLPLGDEQQMEIARRMRGDEGERLVDQAWRTGGVRELVTIPLYLTALLSLPEGSSFPTTKEEVLRRFVDAQALDAGHSAALENVAGGFQHTYLDGLAVFATASANTTISDHDARVVVSTTAKALLDDGQISFINHQPRALLDTLVSNHVLMRASDAQGYSFQHQQFQEWYASYEVERRILQSVEDLAARKQLKAEVFNQRSWTEAILFAIERASRGDREHVTACGAAVLAAFDVDPMLAAEMISRATDDVWGRVSADVMALVRQWHTVGKIDRAVRFMITSGRHEFLDLIWPLLTHENQQVHLSALRAAERFKPSLLGPNAADLLAGLAPAIRMNVLHEIASNSGMDGLDLTTAVAKRGGLPEEKALVVDALSFRRADRHVVELLRGADDATYDLLAKKGHLDEIADEGVQSALAAAQARWVASSATPRDRLSAILQSADNQGLDAEVAGLVSELGIDRKDDSRGYMFQQLRTKFPKAFAEGLLRRIQLGRDLFFGADNILAASGVVVEDEALLKIVLEAAERHDDHAEASASVLGPRSVTTLIAAYLDLLPRRRDAEGKFEQPVCDRCSLLQDRIAHTPGASLVAAVSALTKQASNDEIAALAELCSRTAGDDDRARPFNESDVETVRQLAMDWGERLLASDSATRVQKVSIATLMSHVPSVSLLPILERLLDDNIRRYAAFRTGAKEGDWQDRKIVTEAQNPQMHGYQWAFSAIKAPETDALMVRYLLDEHFGEIAARILAQHWEEANLPKRETRFDGGIDLDNVTDRRAAVAADPTASSAAADAIFAAIDRLLADDASEENKLRAVTLGIVGARLPQGERVSTLNKLLTLAPRRVRASLLLSLVLSGADIDIEMVAQGIAETFEAAKKETWILHESGAYQLRDWFRLLPFATPLNRLTSLLREIPDAQRTPNFLQELLRGLGNISASQAVEEALFALAEDDEDFYGDYHWRQTVLGLGTVSSALRFVELTMKGMLSDSGHDGWRAQQNIAGLIAEHREVRDYVRKALKGDDLSVPSERLAYALGEQPEVEDIILLVELERRTCRAFVGRRSLEHLATNHVPSEHWHNAYDVMPVPVVALRRRLLSLTTDGSISDPASRALVAIDKLRDEYGAPEAEPRHPDLASGRPWPLLTPDPDADDGR